MTIFMLVLGMALGWYSERILWELKRIRIALKPKNKPGVVVPNLAKPISSSTTVVSPKTPARMQYEMDMEMKRQAGLIE